MFTDEQKMTLEATIHELFAEPYRHIGRVPQSWGPWRHSEWDDLADCLAPGSLNSNFPLLPSRRKRYSFDMFRLPYVNVIDTAALDHRE